MLGNKNLPSSPPSNSAEANEMKNKRSNFRIWSNFLFTVSFKEISYGGNGFIKGVLKAMVETMIADKTSSRKISNSLILIYWVSQIVYKATWLTSVVTEGILGMSKRTESKMYSVRMVKLIFFVNVMWKKVRFYSNAIIKQFLPRAVRRHDWRTASKSTNVWHQV